MGAIIGGLGGPKGLRGWKGIKGLKGKAGQRLDALTPALPLRCPAGTIVSRWERVPLGLERGRG